MLSREKPRLRDDEWLRAYTLRSLELKKVLSNPENFDRLFATIRTAFKRIYRAVALDIDGTLTLPGSAQIDEAAAKAIADLLQRGVPVFLITGRGDGSTREAASFIKRNSGLSDWYLRKLVCVILNGVSLIYTLSDSPSDFLGRTKDLASAIPFLPDLIRSLESALYPASSLEVQNILKKHNSVRIILHPSADLDAVRQRVSDVTAQFPTESALYIAHGHYEDTPSISISTTNKRQALIGLADSLGISPDHILRFGDHGEEGGNDFELLDSPAGFSVGRVSRSLEGCLPVLENDLEQVGHAAAATRYLTSLVYLFPSISLSPPWAPTHTRALLTFERLAVRRAREEQQIITQRVRVRLHDLLGQETTIGPIANLRIDDVFDPYSGGVRFRDWELADSNETDPGWGFFYRRLPSPVTRNPRYAWSMLSDTGLILRGPNYYFALSRPPAEVTLSAYAVVVQELLESAKLALSDFIHRSPNLQNFKLALAYADNIRNVLLQLQYVALLVDCIRVVDKPPTTYSSAIYSDMVVPHTRHHFRLMLDSDLSWQHGLKAYVEFVSSLGLMLADAFHGLLPWEDHLNKRNNEKDKKEKKDVLRRWRECDDFLQNVAAVQLGLHELGEKNDFITLKHLVACGAAYGGTELPAIAQIVGERRGYSVVPALVKISLYNERIIGDQVRRGDLTYVEDVLLSSYQIMVLGKDPPSLENSPAIMLDDNVLTGLTLQLLRDLLIVKGADVLGAIIVRFPGFNRQVQMAMPGHGFPDLDLLFGFIRGLASPSPYTRLIYEGEDEERRYLDQTGMFNKARSRIERYLKKNGTFPPGPEDAT